MNENSIEVHATVRAPIEYVWECWTMPEHITEWCHASSDWHAPKAKNNLRVGGEFMTSMEAKDGSSRFKFEGKYTEVKLFERIAYTLTDGRKVQVSFVPTDKGVIVTEIFEPEVFNPHEIQRAGWQAILDNFKRYATCD
jgi:uncharacterized protein YndB with AHSA1/START domain